MCPREGVFPENLDHTFWAKEYPGAWFEHKQNCNFFTGELTDPSDRDKMNRKNYKSVKLSEPGEAMGYSTNSVVIE